MSYRYITSCPVCENKEFSEFLACTDFFTTSETFDLKRCDKCQFVFTQNFPSETIIGKYYDVPEYVSHSDTKKGIVNYLYHFARRFMLKRKMSLITKVSKMNSGNILDYGCGTGYFLNEMAKNGWKTTGIEKSDLAREFALNEFGLEINEPSFLSKMEDKSCDVVTLWHVLEHIENFDTLLSELKRVLKPDGTLILALPNSSSFDARHYREYWAAFDVPRHLWHFTPKTIALVGEKHNMKIVGAKAMPLDSFYISIMSEQNRGSRFAFVKGICVGLIANIVSLANISNQSSLIYLFKK
ncbi:MAG: class I SAM-dependent methyltransferase [Bacteroidales bacterium]|nr:class I SAM-dependent methyltransferase [Bacteroidales bacterium]